MGDRPRHPLRFARDKNEAAEQERKKQAFKKITEPSSSELIMRKAELGGDNVHAIELHGMRAQDALHTLELELDQALRNNKDVIKIIHGKGTGALERVVRGWLTEKKSQGLIADFRSGTAPRDIGAAIYALLAD